MFEKTKLDASEEIFRSNPFQYSFNSKMARIDRKIAENPDYMAFHDYLVTVKTAMETIEKRLTQIGAHVLSKLYRHEAQLPIIFENEPMKQLIRYIWTSTLSPVNRMDESGYNSLLEIYTCLGAMNNIMLSN